MRLSNQKQALARPTHHEKRRGGEWIDHGKEPDLPAGPQSKPPVVPAPNAADGSKHNLKSPQGAEVILTWQQNVWWPILAHQGRRVAFSPAYLGTAGWIYGSPL